MTKHSSPIADQIYSALATYLKRNPATFRPDDSLRDDLGLDSLMTIELLYEIESVFDLQIPDEDFGGLLTIGDVIAYIEKKKQPSAAPSAMKHKQPGGHGKTTDGKRKSTTSKRKHH